jgi:hypothetical protein
MRTYIVVSVFHQKGYPLALCALPTAIPLQLVLCSSDIVYKLPVREGSPRQRVDYSGALRIVFLDGFENG